MKVKRFGAALLAACLLWSFPLPARATQEPAGQTYQEAMAELARCDGGKVLSETELCTVFSYSFVTPRGSYAYLCLIYKPGAPLEEGTVIHLPLPSISASSGQTVLPDSLEVSEDGKTLTYGSYVYPSQDAEIYTVDLTTGETVKSVAPPPRSSSFTGTFLAGRTRPPWKSGWRRPPAQ